MINNLYISHEDYNWNNGSHLLNYKNLDKVISSNECKDYFTSVVDIKFKNIKKVCDSAKKIVIQDLNLYEMCKHDYTDSNFNYNVSILLNFLYKVRHKVSGLNDCLQDISLQKFNSLQNIRNTTENVLWTVGCSFTAGEGVENNQRYGHLLSEYLSIHEINLSRSASCNSWAASQILRSDIKEGDIVVWGLTSLYRGEYSRDWESKPLMAVNLVKDYGWNPNYFDSTTNKILYYRDILNVINFCKKLDVKLYLINFLENGLTPIILKDYNNFYDISSSYNGYNHNTRWDFVDYGTDNCHPGPKQHKIFAEKIYKFITQKEKEIV